MPFYTTLKEQSQLNFDSSGDLTKGTVTFGTNTTGIHTECGYAGTVTYTVNSTARAQTVGSYISVTGNTGISDEGGSSIFDKANVYFPYSFSYTWQDNAVPNHVAQRNVLKCIDNYTSSVSPVGVYTYNADNIRLVNNGDGTAMVSLLSPFSSSANAIHIEAPNGEGGCNVSLESRLPYFECGEITPSTNYVDAQSKVQFTYYAAAANGTKTADAMAVSKTEGTGNYLFYDLVEERIAPVITSDSGNISTLACDQNVMGDGTYMLYTHIHNYDDAFRTAMSNAGSSSYINAGSVTIQMDRKDSSWPSRGSEQRAFRAYNPWRWISGVAMGGIMNDYTLYHEPKGWKSEAGAGWEENPEHAPVETASYTSEINNIVVSNANNLKLNASFQDGAGYLGYKVCSGVNGPNNVSSDFVSGTTYKLYVQRTNPSSYDWEAIGNYLYYDLGHYIPGYNPSASEAERKAIVDAAFDEAGNELALTAWYRYVGDAWNDAPDGVSQSNPSALSGLTFLTKTKTSTPNQWTLKFSMADLGEGDIATHNAGKIDVVLQIVNPYNSLSPTLDKKVGEAYVRLHVYVWPAVIGPNEEVTPYVSGHDCGWSYGVYPFAYSEGKPIYALDGGSGYDNFWDKHIIDFAEETWSNVSTTYRTTAHPAPTGSISRNINIKYEPVYWQFRNDDFISLSDPQATRKAKLMSALSNSYSHDRPIMFKETSDLVMVGGLASDTFYCANETLLYYDPSGSSYIYTYPGSDMERTDKLFVIYIGNGDLLKAPYYFAPENGFSD